MGFAFDLNRTRETKREERQGEAYIDRGDYKLKIKTRQQKKDLRK